MKKVALHLLFLILVPVVSAAQDSYAAEPSDLARNFVSPPVDARPWTYWFWMNGNISREGITADLEAMARVGVGGVLVFSIDSSVPEGPVGFMTPAWRELVEHAVREADRLGLEFSINNTDGWNSGGPWITPETGMKKLVWSSAQVQGGRKITQAIAQPYVQLDYYRDIAVLAFPTPIGKRINGPGRQVKVTGDLTNGDPQLLVDGDAATIVEFPANEDWRILTQENGTGYYYLPPKDRSQFHHILFEFPQATTVRSLRIEAPVYTFLYGEVIVRLEYSNDGNTFQLARECDLGFSTDVTLSFDAFDAKYVRVAIANRVPIKLQEIVLSDAAAVHYQEVKSAQADVGCRYAREEPALRKYGHAPNESLPANYVVRGEDVVNLTNRMDEAGNLEWDCPDGNWTIVRFGMTAGGNQNGPATRLGKGLDCDKLNPVGAEAQIAGFSAKMAQQMGELTGTSFTHVENDSWESGSQTWTEIFADEFEKRRGYSVVQYLPVLAGFCVMDSHDVSERVLWDYRRSLADLIRFNYHRPLRELLNEKKLRYLSEGAGPLQFMVDPINYQAEADVPMGEFWHAVSLYEDNRASSSAAHIYGKRFVGAEAFTGNTLWSPAFYELKSLGDRAFCEGVNWFFFHNYTHQPWLDVYPGMSYSVWGWHFQRTNTWWEQSPAYLSYLTRCQHMLRQGEFVADICQYIGDNVPNRVGFREDAWLPIPDGYDYDGCNSEVLKQFTVKNGRLTLPHGMSYRVLLLPDSQTIMPDVMEKIHELVRDGAVIVGPKPYQSPSLRDYPHSDETVQKLAADLWGDCDGKQITENTFGEGQVIWGKSWNEIFAGLGLRSDFDYVADSATRINYIHRRVENADVYFVANRESKPVNTLCTFRITGKAPEIWAPDTGNISELSVYESLEGTTRLPLHLDPSGSVFVVFRKKAEEDAIVSVKKDGKSILASDGKKPVLLPALRSSKNAIVIETDQPGDYKFGLANGSTKSVSIKPLDKPVILTGPWNVVFPPNRGAPDKATFDELTDWSKHTVEGIKYFSGTATYKKEFDVPAAWANSHNLKILLDLGSVKEIAEVKVNGEDLGILWKPPYLVDIGSEVTAGSNSLEVRVTNLWINRLLGDEQYPDDCEWNSLGEIVHWPEWLQQGQQRPEPRRVTFSNVKGVNQYSYLLPSGLLGPVELKVLVKREVE